MKFSQVRLLVDDAAAAFRFYQDELGLTPSFGAEGEAYASFDAGGGTVAIFDRDAQSAVSPLRTPGDDARSSSSRSTTWTGGPNDSQAGSSPDHPTSGSGVDACCTSATRPAT